MKNLILHPTDMSQWHALVNEAEARVHLVLNEPTESYLVFLLMRFAHTAQLMESVMGLDFLEAMRWSGSRQIELLREVGDKSLLFCGLFPGMAAKRHVRLEYFSNLGQAAYLSASELDISQTSRLYSELSTQFLTMQHILQAMRSEMATSMIAEITPNAVKH